MIRVAHKAATNPTAENLGDVEDEPNLPHINTLWSSVKPSRTGEIFAIETASFLLLFSFFPSILVSSSSVHRQLSLLEATARSGSTSISILRDTFNGFWRAPVLCLYTRTGLCRQQWILPPWPPKQKPMPLPLQHQNLFPHAYSSGCACGCSNSPSAVF